MKKFYFFIVALFAMIAANAENPTLYLRGGINNWGTGDTYKFVENDGVYTLTLDELSGEFKIAEEDWTQPNYGGASDIEIGTTYTLTESGSNCTLKESAIADATITFTLATKELVVTGAAAEKNYELYLRGVFNDFAASDEYKFTTSDYKVYTLALDKLSHATESGFQIADDTWAVRYNVQNYELGYGVYTAEKGVEYNMNVAEDLQHPILVLDTEAGTLTIEYAADACTGRYVGSDWVNGEYFILPIIPVEDETGAIVVTMPDFLSSGNTFHVNVDAEGVATTDISSDGVVGKAQYTVDGEQRWYLYNYNYYGCPAYDSTYRYITLNLMTATTTADYYYFYLYIYLPLDESASEGEGDTTSVSNIAVDANAPVEYFNLQGVRVANPENGLFIRRQGNKATKVLVK
jgi:hypothetical protein